MIGYYVDVVDLCVCYFFEKVVVDVSFVVVLVGMFLFGGWFVCFGVM